ncbi:MAG: DNA polymerase III subunit delta [Arsenophonus endosymbiont of Ceratovacuna japonica]
MIQIYPEQLTLHLYYKLQHSYLVFGNDPFLIQESVDKIYKVAKKQGFSERSYYLLDTTTDWNAIYCFSQSCSLFSNKQVLILIATTNNITTITSKHLIKLYNLLHSNLLLILQCGKLTKAQKNSIWYKKIGQNGIYINCVTPVQFKLLQWITKRTKEMSISLDNQAIKLLCYYYEGNLLALNQLFNHLLLLYPNNHINLINIKNIINNSVNFTPYHLIDALLIGKIKRALYILQQLRLECYEIIILLRIIQREIILLLKLKQQNNNKNLKKLFDEYNVLHFRHFFIKTAIQRLSLNKLQIAIQLITQAELSLKNNYNDLIWIKLETLSMILCDKVLPEIFFHDSTNQKNN